MYKYIKILVAPYWNLNKIFSVISFTFDIILVAPYWNLNFESEGEENKVSSILVAPYWNLNIGITIFGAAFC